MYARHCHVGRSPSVGGMLYSSSQRGRDEGKRRGRESEKSESAKTDYRGMRAADAHRSSRIASGYPAIKSKTMGREGVRDIEEREKASKIITGDPIYTPRALSRERRETLDQPRLRRRYNRQKPNVHNRRSRRCTLLQPPPPSLRLTMVVRCGKWRRR